MRKKYKKGEQEIQKGVQQEMEMVHQIDHGCHVTSLTSSEHTLSLFIFSPLFPRRWKRNENKLSLNFLDVLSTQTIYFTTFSNVSYKLRLDPKNTAETEIIEENQNQNSHFLFLIKV